MKKASPLLSLILWSCALVVFVQILVRSSNSPKEYLSALTGDSGGNHWRVISDVTLDPENISDLDLSWSSGQLDIAPSTDENIRLVEQSPQKRERPIQSLDYSVDGGVLRVRMPQKDWSSWHFSLPFQIWLESPRLTVYLPDQYFENITLSVTSGEIRAHGFHADKTIIKASSGSITLDALQTDSLQIGISSGEVTGSALQADTLLVKENSGDINLSGSWRSVQAELTSGNITLSDELAPETLTLRTTSGDMSFAMPDNGGFTLAYRVTSGDIEGDFGIDISRGSGSLAYGDGSREYTADCTSGNIIISKKQ